jgi:hypothetical protein
MRRDTLRSWQVGSPASGLVLLRTRLLQGVIKREFS